MNAAPEVPAATLEQHSLRLRMVVSTLLVLLVLLYSVGVVGGWIESGSRIDAVHLALIALTGVLVAALLRPQTLERLKRVKLSGFELAMLARVQEKQAEHQDQLDDIRLMLPLLLPDTERRHVANLLTSETQAYRGGHTLRTELRRLRSMRLPQTKTGRTVAELKMPEHSTSPTSSS